MLHFVATAYPDGSALGLLAFVASVLLSVLTLLAFATALIVRVSSRRFTQLIYRPAVALAILSVTSDFISIAAFQVQDGKIPGGISWHVGQNGFALLVGAAALTLTRRLPAAQLQP